MTNTRPHDPRSEGGLERANRHRAAIPTTRERLHRLADELELLTSSQLARVHDMLDHVEWWP